MADQRMKVLVSNSFSFPDQQLWFGKARLSQEGVLLTGWTLQGRYRRMIPLTQIVRVAWWPWQEGGVNFVLFLADDEEVTLHLKRAAAAWKFEIDHLIGHNDIATLGPLPPTSPAKKDMAA